MFETVDSMAREHEELERQLGASETHADARLAKRLNQRYAHLSRVLTAKKEWDDLEGDLEAARELAAEDPTFADEVETLSARRHAAEERLRFLLVPRDPTDDKDAILEVKSGEGGEESALFAGDLLRMYSRYAEQRGWKVEVLDAAESDLGGYKSVTLAVKAKGTPEPGEAPYGLLKFEGGVHRVQRVPVTESQGRVHTSAAGVLVLPEAEQVDVTLDENDLRIDVFRSSGPGGQSVNTTDSAVRITHVPTGIVVSCQNEKSQLQNKEQALRILRARLLAAAQEEADAAASDARRSQVRTVDRSERIRTYNFPENRISDHRTGYKAYNLDQVLDGDLQPVLDSCVAMDLADRLAALEHVTPRAASWPRPRRPLREAGVPSPEHDAAELLAHVLGTDRSRLPLVDEVPAAALGRVRRTRGPARGPRAAAAPDRAGVVPPRRARRRPGRVRAPARDRAAGRLGRRVGRPSRGAASWSTSAPAPARSPRRSRTRCRRPGCTPWSSTSRRTAGPQRNLAGTGVDLRQGDFATAFDDLAGTVDVVVCNPPYVPLEAWESVAPEARDHDPHLALFSGADGLDAIRVLAVRAAVLLRPGGVLGVEHADVQGEAVPAVLTATGRWTEVRDHRDLAGRPRFTTARLAP